MVNDSKKETLPMNTPEKIETFFFFASFLPLIYAVYKGFTGMFFGLQNFAWFFGITAIIYTLICEFVLLFLPIFCLAFQIQYAKKYFGTYPKVKIAARILIGVIIAAALFSSFFATQCWKMRFMPQIKNYLEDKYGENALENTSLDEPFGAAMIVKAHTPILPENATFEIHVTNAMDPIYDTLVNEFYKAEPDFYPELKIFIKEKENIPMDIDFNIVSIKFDDYKFGDDFTVLFERTEYEIKEIRVDYEKVTDDLVLELTNQVWEEIYPNIPVAERTAFDIKVSEKGVDAVTVFIHHPRNKKSEVDFLVWTSKWDGKSDLDGKKIELPL
ncbi:MAG: hypothetical protein IJK65_04580 [Clostridiales bacterium]|nr:hypothetical protein [Clostridiales bacterium]